MMARPSYVGQTRKLRSRLQRHTGATRGSNQASFAFLVPKREAASAGLDIARYRAVLEADPEFVPHFDAARALVAGMDVQFVELADAITQTPKRKPQARDRKGDNAAVRWAPQCGWARSKREASTQPVQTSGAT